MVDFVPLLQRLPNLMASRGKKLHEGLVETYGGMINEIAARMKRGEEVPDCLVKTMLLTREEEELDHIDMSILCAAFMIGGVETAGVLIRKLSGNCCNMHIFTRRLPLCNGLQR